MNLQKIPLDKIDVISSFNIRTEFGQEETRDLEESLKITNGNIQPILVCKKEDRFDLISGERRFKALKHLGFAEASCIIYDELDELQKSQLMYNENIGRKNLSWREEVKAIKKLKILGFDISADNIAKHKKISKQSAWDLLEALHYIEEFPDLINEKTRKQCIERYKRIKRLEQEAQDNIKEQKITIKEALTSHKIARHFDVESMVIDELKEEVHHYKEQMNNIYELIKKLDKVERLTNGVWLIEEIKMLIEASRSCETFGMLDKHDSECIACHKETPNIYDKCEFYFEEFEK
jgi:ParB family chromosome partitioning protein